MSAELQTYADEDVEGPPHEWADAIALVHEDLATLITRHPMGGHGTMSNVVHGTPEGAAARIAVALDVLGRLEVMLRRSATPERIAELLLGLDDAQWEKVRDLAGMCGRMCDQRGAAPGKGRDWCCCDPAE